METAEPTLVLSLEAKHARLAAAVAAGKPALACLRLWSNFVRARDAHRCVDCHSPRRIAAHHICRKSFLPEAQFQTGNGITLCRECHREVHGGFNGRADLSMPMDAQGGEKIDTMERLYGALAEDARERGLLRDDFYFLSDSVLAKFKMFQGINPFEPFDGYRIEQAFLIWRELPRQMLRAIVRTMFEGEEF
jgi:hypothetical protein